MKRMHLACLLTVPSHPQDVSLCAGCHLQDQAGLSGAEAVWLGFGPTQSQDAVARHSRRGRCPADRRTLLSTEHAQSELRIHELAPQQRERVSTKYVGLTLSLHYCHYFVTVPVVSMKFHDYSDRSSHPAYCFVLYTNCEKRKPRCPICLMRAGEGTGD